MAANESGGGLPKGRSLTWVVWATVTIFVLLGSSILIAQHQSSRKSVRIYVLVRSLPPFSRVEPTDVTTMVRPMSDLPSGVITTRDELTVHYLLSRAEHDTPITRAQVGPTAPADLSDRFLLSVSGGPELGLAGQLERGDTVEVLLPPGPTGVSPTPMANAFVLQVQTYALNAWVVTLAILARPNNEQSAAVAAGRVALVLRPSSARG